MAVPNVIIAIMIRMGNIINPNKIWIPADISVNSQFPVLDMKASCRSFKCSSRHNGPQLTSQGKPGLVERVDSARRACASQLGPDRDDAKRRL